MSGDTQPGDGLYLSNTKLISLLVGIVGTLVTAVCAVIWYDEQTTAAALNQHIIDAANKAQLYVRKDEMGEINARLQRIEDKLDEKADKQR
jgi:hypothetical protein